MSSALSLLLSEVTGEARAWQTEFPDAAWGSRTGSALTWGAWGSAGSRRAPEVPRPCPVTQLGDHARALGRQTAEIAGLLRNGGLSEAGWGGGAAGAAQGAPHGFRPLCARCPGALPPRTA